MIQKNHDKHNIDALVGRFGVAQIIEMFDLMPDILFWVKDEEGRFAFVNKFFLEHLGVNSLEDIIGKKDADFSPKHIASQFASDDLKVMQGEIVDSRLEMNMSQSNEVAWFTTSKKPLLDELGNPIGSYGISRHLEKTYLALSSMDALKTPVEFIRTNYMQHISIEQLAEIAHLSLSALERRFKKHLGKTPKQFINEVRLENARRLLIESNLSISVIANETGFNDHSYFSRLFNRFFGCKPSIFRENYR